MELNARQIETAKPQDKTYKMADGGGLYLEVSAKGSKYCRMKYRHSSDKKEELLCVPVNYVSRVGMSSTSINLSGEYLQNEKKLGVSVTRTVV